LPSGFFTPFLRAFALFFLAFWQKSPIITGCFLLFISRRI
jgi:hypothetical protein